MTDDHGQPKERLGDDQLVAFYATLRLTKRPN